MKLVIGLFTGLVIVGCTRYDTPVEDWCGKQNPCPLGMTCNTVTGECEARDAVQGEADVFETQARDTGADEIAETDERWYEDVCVPKCQDRECGDDGCGGKCGSCGDGKACVDGQCVHVTRCGDNTCDPQENCATCPADCGCKAPDVCYNAECCTPKTCEDLGYECGSGYEDGCGSRLYCGECGLHKVCKDGRCVDQPYCGNGKCEGSAGENCATCPADCGCDAVSVCVAGQCQPDQDKDGVPEKGFDTPCPSGVVKNCVDNCPDTPNPGQMDMDNDGVGDACDDDIDGDGDPNTTDCAPDDPNVNHLAKEKCDGRDDDCDGVVDQAGADGCKVFYSDKDGDGFGVEDESKCLCTAGYPYTATVYGDCDDGNKAINPKSVEICDDIDNNCDKHVDEGCDDDKDGYCDVNMQVKGAPKVCNHGGGDCNDKNKAVNPGVWDICGNKVDDDCDGKTDTADPQYCWFDPHWLNRRVITIRNNGDADGTNYQVKLTVDTKLLINQGLLKTNCSDIRFIDRNGKGIPYWIRDGCNSNTTHVWLKIPALPKGKDTVVLMYFHNPAAGVISGEKDVVTFYEDWEHGIDSKWGSHHGWVLAGDHYHGARSLHSTVDGADLWTQVQMPLAGVVDFYYKVNFFFFGSCSGKGLNFYVNGSLLLNRCKFVEWTHYAHALSKGDHRLDWRIRKSSAYGDAYVDYIRVWQTQLDGKLVVQFSALQSY